MYFGELLEYKCKDTGNEYEKLGFKHSKTVKYVIEVQKVLRMRYCK